MTFANSINDFPIAAPNPRKLDASNTELIGGSWSTRLLPYLSPTPAFEQATGGWGAQDFGPNIGSTAGDWENPKSRNLVWTLGANDILSDNILAKQNSTLHNLLAVAGWVAGNGQYYAPEGGSSNGIYTLSKMIPSSSEGDGSTCVVKGDPGWYMLFTVTNATREVIGKIEEGSRRIDIGWNGDAFGNYSGSLDAVGIPYFSTTGEFTCEFWTSLASNIGYFLGVRAISSPKSVAIFNEVLNWNATVLAADHTNRYASLLQAIDNFGILWAEMGGGFYRGCLPTSGYMMSDQIHIDNTNETPYLHAQYVNQILR